MNEISNIKRNQEDLHMLIGELMESMQDVQNIIQLLEISLQKNEDDDAIIRSVHIIERMIGSIIEHNIERIIHLCSDSENTVM